ncbi:hypothetical protein ACTXGJ_00530 [Psychrobacter sp. 1Y11]|uniref:hypothetical protein n=1 Tax=Psychrobacter sp. 1Y11 TaxID=3457446 RepID=UPI003FCFD13A
MRQSQKFFEATDIYTYLRHLQQMLIMVGILLFVLSSVSALANPFANNIPNSAPNACPADHKMYYIGRSNPTYTLKETRGLVWKQGNQERDRFTFDEGATNKIFFMQFTGIDLNNNQINNQDNNRRNTPPFFGGITGATSNAINLAHNSPAVRNTNNTVRLSSNWPMSKIGFKIQDLDASLNTGASLAYIEQARALNNGKLSLAYTPPALPFHDVSNGGSTITGIAGRNCSLNECNIDAAWGYTPANTEVVLEHGITETSINSPHAVGYSDFYYCLAPPRIVLQKVLTGARVQTTDQFSLQVTSNNTVPTNNFTTTGSGSTIDNNTTATAVAVDPNTTFTIVESVIGGGDIINYDATYSCSNATTLSATDLSSASGSTVYNSSDNTRSFTLSNLNFGDEITCTITNTPTAYTFSGVVFNDNGGISNMQADADNADITSISSPYSNNSSYFNGLFDTSLESGITDSTVSLVNCATSTTVYGTQTVSSTGAFEITAPAGVINSNSNNICLVEERVGNDYPIRTTLATKAITIQPDTLNYDDNFGRVVAANRALVLRKAQYVNDCPTTLDYSAATLNTLNNPNPRSGFSEDGVNGSNLIPGQCIAYRITATNRANLPISDFVMQDTLQKKGIKGALITSVLIGPIHNADDYATDSIAIDENGTVITRKLSLDPRKSRNFYFNTKYGTTNGNNP